MPSEYDALLATPTAQPQSEYDALLAQPQQSQQGGVISGIAAGIGRALNPINLIKGALDLGGESDISKIKRYSMSLKDIVSGVPVREALQKNVPEVAQERETVFGEHGTREQAAALTGIGLQAGLLALPFVHGKLRDIAFPKTEQPLAAEKASGTEVIKNATQERQVQESVQPKRTGDDAFRASTETGVSGGVRPAAEGAAQTQEVAPPVPQPEQIVSTAVQTKEGIKTGTFNQPHEEIVKGAPEESKGFMVRNADGTERFVGRTEAADVAKAAGQVKPENAGTTELHSQQLGGVVPIITPAEAEPLRAAAHKWIEKEYPSSEFRNEPDHARIDRIIDVALETKTNLDQGGLTKSAEELKSEINNALSGHLRKADITPFIEKPSPVSVPTETTTGGFMPPVVTEMFSTLGKSLDELQGRISDVKWGKYKEGDKFNKIEFKLDGVTHEAELKGRNKDFVLSDNPEVNKGLAVRTILDEHAVKTGTETPVPRTSGATTAQPLTKTKGGVSEKVQKGQDEGQGREGVLGTVPSEQPPPETPEALGQALSEKPRLAGPSNRVLQERALRGEIPQAPGSGIGVLKEDLVAKANARYSPERAQIAGEKALRGETTLDDEADVVLHEEKLTKAAADAERAMKLNPTDPALQQAHSDAVKAMSDWQHGPIAAIKTKWSGSGINLQGATDVDTGTVVGLQKLAWDTAKRDFTPKELPIMNEAADRVTKSMAAEKASIAKANEQVQKVLKPSRLMDLNQLRESLAETLKSITC